MFCFALFEGFPTLVLEQWLFMNEVTDGWYLCMYINNESFNAWIVCDRWTQLQSENLDKERSYEYMNDKFHLIVGCYIQPIAYKVQLSKQMYCI